jgi:hypothetical protein
MAAFEIVNPNMKRMAKKIEAVAEEQPEATVEEPAAKPKAAAFATKYRRGSGGFVNSWKK